jgi:hypothetical protein
MKKMIYAATVTLACLSTIPLILLSTSLHSTAYAAETTCEFMPSSAATGDFIQQEIDAIAHCNAAKDSTSLAETVHLTKSTSSHLDNTNTRDTQEVQDENRLFCPAIPHGTTAEDFQYRAALERCKYGS